MPAPRDRFFDWPESERNEYVTRLLRIAGIESPNATQIAALCDIRERSGVSAFHRELDKLGSAKK
jgi:hypothetical protein